MSEFLEKDMTGGWNTVPPIPIEKSQDVNCHKFVLYAIGMISWNEMVSDPSEQRIKGTDFTFGEKIRTISDALYTLVKDEEGLSLLAQTSCQIGKAYVGQVMDAKTGEMAHSFLVKRESRDHYLCFDKPGFKYSFTVSDLDAVLNFVNKDGERSNRDQKWRFVALESIEKRHEKQ